MNVRKQAAKDAFEFARAQMFYGEGAGTRRKLIKAQVEHRIATIPGYAQAYNNAMLAQDMVEHAEKARKMRKNIDRTKKIERNVRGLTTGNKQALTTGVAVAGTVIYYAHMTGYDKVAWEYSKKKYKRAKNWVHAKRIGLHIPDTPAGV
jgi:hypothetical protein